MRSVGNTPVITGQQIKSLFKNPLKLHSKNLILLYNDAPDRGVAFSVKKNICKTNVERNRIKRLLRDAYREREHLFSKNRAMFFIALKCGSSVEKSDFENDMTAISKRMNDAE